MCGGCYKDLYSGSYYTRTSNGPAQDNACCTPCSFSPVQQLTLSTCESLDYEKLIKEILSNKFLSDLIYALGI